MFPNETPHYRAARDRLLDAETELRRQVERVARMRRKLPLGGALKEDYVFDAGAGRRVKLSELFHEGKDTLLIYSCMFGPKTAQPCPMCTSFLDSIEGAVDHFTQLANPAVVVKSLIARVKKVPKNAAGGDCHSCLPPTIHTTATTTEKMRRATGDDERVCTAQGEDLSFVRG